MEIIGMIGVLIFIIYILFRGPKYLNPIFYNPVFLVVLVLATGIVFTKSQLLGAMLLFVFILILYGMYKRKVVENFDIVEDNVDKIIEFDDDSLLGSLQNDEKNVEGVWASSVLGKEMGMNKG